MSLFRFLQNIILFIYSVICWILPYTVPITKPSTLDILVFTPPFLAFFIGLFDKAGAYLRVGIATFPATIIFSIFTVRDLERYTGGSVQGYIPWSFLILFILVATICSSLLAWMGTFMRHRFWKR